MNNFGWVIRVPSSFDRILNKNGLPCPPFDTSEKCEGMTSGLCVPCSKIIGNFDKMRLQ
ncbi:hypothetical protein C1H46_002472 [Malus baccata]|uniref:Uncharacterized protein n=1 Tax=Malus baccata TaxID=106549 RepID=A0A540NLE9_MALBA|nr:hypothetical protein C1H46_002472 [Malus baccata]